MSLLVNLCCAALALFLSKLFRRAIPALALPLGLLLVSLLFEPFFSFYAYNRLLAQIWSYLPIQRLSETFLLDQRLVWLGDTPVDCISASVLLYGGLALLFLSACLWLCRRHAVEKE